MLRIPDSQQLRSQGLPAVYPPSRRILSVLLFGLRRVIRRRGRLLDLNGLLRLALLSAISESVDCSVQFFKLLTGTLSELFIVRGIQHRAGHIYHCRFAETIGSKCRRFLQRPPLCPHTRNEERHIAGQITDFTQLTGMSRPDHQTDDQAKDRPGDRHTAR